MVTTACLAAIVLLIDVSGSVGPLHYAAQRDGAAAAFEHPQVIRMVEASGGIAVTVVEFSYAATTRVGWTILTDSASSHVFASEVRRLQRPGAGTITALGVAIEHGRTLLRDVPCTAARGVIDVSTDGYALDGDLRPARARDAAAADGIEINAMVFPPFDGLDPAELDAVRSWLRAHVATGFVRVAPELAAYAEVFRQKFVMEVVSRD